MEAIAVFLGTRDHQSTIVVGRCYGGMVDGIARVRPDCLTATA